MFTALWPPEAVREHLSDALRYLPDGQVAEATEGLRRFRFLPSRRWHVTLCFHGVADPGVRSDELERAMSDFREAMPPRLRLASAGTFRGVLWVGVEADEPDRPWLSSLAAAVGADADSFHAHVTIGRWARGHPRAAVAQLFAGYQSPWWRPAEVALVRSEQRGGAQEYETVYSAPLTPRATG